MTLSQISCPLIGFILPLPGLTVGYAVPVYEVNCERKIQSIDPRRLIVDGLTSFSADENFVSIESLENRRRVLIIKDKYWTPPLESDAAVFAVLIADQLVMGTAFELRTWFADNRRSLDTKLAEFPNFRADLLAFLDLPEQAIIPAAPYKTFTDHAHARYDVRQFRKSREREYA